MIVTRGENEYRVSGSSIMNPSGYLLANQTGDFVTTGQTGAFYPAVGNPSGYVQSTQTGVFVTTGQTGQFYPAVGNPSGYVRGTETGNFVDVSSPQTIRGPKTFTNTATFSGVVIASGSGININSGVVIMPFTTKTSNYYVTNSDFTISCNGTFSVNLSGTSPLAGRMINVKNSAAGIISLIPRPMLLDNWTGARTLLSGTCLTIQADGTNWVII